MKLLDVLTIILGISAVVGVGWLMHRSYHLENRWIRRLMLVAPPFALIPCYWTSIERATSDMWVIATFFLLVSFCTGLVGFVRVLLDPRNSERWERLIRPGLVIIIYFSAMAYVKRAPGYTEAIGKSVFDTIQQQCSGKDQCPPVIEGWHCYVPVSTHSADKPKFYVASWTLAGKGPLKFPIAYLRSHDGLEFKIVIAHTKSPWLFMLKQDPVRFVQMATHSDLPNDKTCMGLYTLLTTVEGGVDRHFFNTK